MLHYCSNVLTIMVTVSFVCTISSTALFEQTEHNEQSKREERNLLLEAIRDKDFDKVSYIYHQSYRITKSNRQEVAHLGSAVLCWATYFNDKEVVISLLDYGIPVDEVDAEGNTPLIWASALGNHDIVSLLLKRQADVYKINKAGFTAVDAALKNGQSRVAFVLVDHIVTINSEQGLTPLPWCIQQGHYTLARLLLNSPLPQVKVDEVDSKGNTALIFAVKQRRIDIVKVLLAKGASVLISNKIGETPLSIALDSSDHEMIYLLSQQAAGMDNSNHFNYGALSWGVRSGNIFLVRSILKRDGIKIDMQDKGGNTPLYWAVNEGFHSIVRLLLKAGADANAKNSQGVSPAMLAAQKGDSFTLSILGEEQFAALKDTNAYGWTPLITASRYGHTATVRELLDRKVAVDEVDNEKNTALYWAARFGHCNIVRLLLEHGADVYKKNIYGWTALYWAIRNKHARVVRLLLNCCDSSVLMQQDSLFMTYCKITKSIKDSFLSNILNRSL